MSAPPCHSTSLLIGKLSEATAEVFETMVFRSIEGGGVVIVDEPVSEEVTAVNGTVKIVGSVGFAGSCSGVVVFHSSLSAAREITGAMLGLAPEEVNGEVPDAIGEITNMIAGSFRTKMTTEGDAWAISVPTVTVGSDFSIKSLCHRHRAVLPFRMGGSRLVVELIVPAA
ncbi:MAG: chemotaxis protein CheX [Vicinamibacterales bacterium]